MDQFQDFGTVDLNTTMSDISISNFLSQQPYMLPLAQNFTNLTKIANGEELCFFFHMDNRALQTPATKK